MSEALEREASVLQQRVHDLQQQLLLQKLLQGASAGGEGPLSSGAVSSGALSSGNDGADGSGGGFVSSTALLLSHESAALELKAPLPQQQQQQQPLREQQQQRRLAQASTMHIR